jgi:hypothetical protein
MQVSCIDATAVSETFHKAQTQIDMQTKEITSETGLSEISPSVNFSAMLQQKRR